MICPSCKGENLEQSKFCSHCGAVLPSEGAAPLEPADRPPETAGDAQPDSTQGSAGGAKSPEKGTQDGTAIHPPVPPSSSDSNAQKTTPKKNSLFWILGCSCAAVLLFLVLAAVAMYFGYTHLKNTKGTLTRTPAPTVSEIPANPKFVNATMCGRLGPHKEPVDNKTEFSPRARVNCSVEVKEQAEGDIIKALWYKGSEKLAEQKHTQKKPLYDYIAFYIYKTTGLTAGNDYKVEIYINDVMVASKDFSVESEEGEDKWGSYIKEAVLCLAFEDNYKPIDPAESFGTTDTFRCSVLVDGLPSGTKANAKWYFGTQFVAEGSVVPTDDIQYIGFFCKPKTEWPKGAYRVEIYFNDHLVETKSFTVEEER